MTECQLRENVRRQILQNFEENKKTLIESASTKNSITLTELRSIVRSELIKRLHEADEKQDPEVEKAVDQMTTLNSQMAAIASQIEQPDDTEGESKKKSESLVVAGAGLLIGLPGLFHVMSKMASLAAKMFNKVGSKFDPEKEGETFHRWAEKTHNFYIDSILKPIVKKVFKKQIEKDEKKARIYAEVAYAVLLAAVAIHAGIEIVSHMSFSSMGGAVQAAYEAAHGAETGLTSARMLAGLRAAFAAISEMQAVEAIQTTAAAVA
jgi:hypothetical protein